MADGTTGSGADLTAFTERLGVDLDPEALRLALTHRSYAFENGDLPTNERLEFLGDAVLGLAVTDVLFRDNPDLPEGRLAKMRSAVVNTRALATVARDLGVGEYLLLGRGEQVTGGRDKDSILADALEAIIGAVYSTLGPETAAAFVRRIVGPMLDDAIRLGAGMDWKTTLQETAAQRGLGAVSYEVTGVGPDHQREFTALAQVGGITRGSGVGPNKKTAEARAAEAAVRAIVDGERLAAGRSRGVPDTEASRPHGEPEPAGDAASPAQS
ncbi:ribonuclease III [Sediminivirga luteola]|uniref:Ribonuclease 3 n=1 Tax=Sediminivirga luteola TaxID=1774748 RepID=A0A8J2TV95_9MICO|nr:ribonuclease III [Sediminivirga luteola]MCI2264594.1 ribonuclease III [Sediminivirga luteola]GGA03153.1 ribonuclease 3 [Sediminivirga luteola]